MEATAAVSFLGCFDSLLTASTSQIPFFSRWLRNSFTNLLSVVSSQATFLLYGAVSNKERVQRQGQYYFVTWYDADPDQAVTLVMMYRQGKTGSRILTKSISYPAGRKGGTQSPVFEFIGDDAKENGQILAWKLLLKDQNGKTLSERHSYLWNDKV